MSDYGLEVWTSDGESTRISESGLGYSFLIQSGVGEVTVGNLRQSQVEFVVSQSNAKVVIGDNDPVKSIDDLLLAGYQKGAPLNDYRNTDYHIAFDGIINHNLNQVKYEGGHITKVVAPATTHIHLLGLYNMYGGNGA